MKYRGKISGLLFGNTMVITEWIAFQDILTNLDAKALYITAGIYIIQMILSCYVGHRYDKKQELKNRIQGLKSREFSVDFFEKLVALSQRDVNKISLYVLSVKNWGELKISLLEPKLEQIVSKVEQTLVQTVRKSDVITCWEENKYVIIVVDTGHEQSTVMNRITKNLTKVLQDDIVHITFLFGGATYPLEGDSFEELLELAQARLYQNRDIQKIE